MADFSNINVGSLRSALNNLSDGIDYKSSNNAISSLSSDAYWSSSCKSIFINALDKQINTNYENLKEKLSNYKTICDYIKSWQDLKKQNEEYTKKMNDAYSKRYSTVMKYKKDSSGNYETDSYGNKKKEYKQEFSSYWDGEYRRYKGLIEDNKNKMKDYENKVNNLI